MRFCPHHACTHIRSRIIVTVVIICANVKMFASDTFNVLLLFLIWTGYLVVLVLVPAQSIL